MIDQPIETLVSEIRAMRVELARLSSLVDRKRAWYSVRSAAKESGRSEREIRNAIVRKTLEAIPTVARGGKHSWKIRPQTLAEWIGKQA